MNFLKNIHISLRLLLLIGLLILSKNVSTDLVKSYYYHHPIIITINKLIENPDEYFNKYLIVSDAVALKGAINKPREDFIIKGTPTEQTKKIVDSMFEHWKVITYGYVENLIVIKKDTNLLAITYPIFSIKQKQENRYKYISEIKSHIVVENTKIATPFDSESFFNNPEFKVNGFFTDRNINHKDKDLLKEYRYNISDNSFIIETGKEPSSFWGLLILSIFIILFLILILNSLQRF